MSMTGTPHSFFFFLPFIIFVQSGIAQVNYTIQWPSFRGPFASGIMDGADLPDQWNIKTGENIKWVTEIPGLGHSSPVIWGDKMFITTAISGSGIDSLKVGLYGDIDNVNDESIHEFKIYCINKNTGQILWERLSQKGIPAVKRHTKASHANSTPATNGHCVIAFFGSEGLYCYDFDGKLIWKRDFGRMNAGPYTDPDTDWGFASSPIIHNNRIIIQCDFLGDCFLASLDLETGTEIWKTPREEISTWSTPTIYAKEDITQIIVNGYKHMGGYDFNTGEEIWEMSGGGDAPIPTPVIAHDLIFIHSAHGRYSPIYAVRPDAKGNITLDKESTSNEYIVWSIKRGGAYIPTDLIYGNYLYNMRMNGQLICYEAKTGKQIYREYIPEARGITSSGIAADGKLYYTTEQGDIFTLKAGPSFEIISKNSLNDLCMATPAISGKMIYFRTQHYVIAVGK